MRSRERLEWLQTMGYTAYKGGPGGFWRAHEPPAAIDDFVRRAYLMRGSGSARMSSSASTSTAR